MYCKFIKLKKHNFIFGLFGALMAFSGSMMAQLSGTKTIGIDYPTLAAAIADINAQGVNGPLVINVPTGYTETAPVGGYALTTTGTAANTITFQKNGAGVNPLLSAYATGTATPASAIQDGVFRLIGSDYVTINGIDIVDNNAANPATMEYGYAFYKASLNDGCQNNTIKNCVITLNRINNASSTAPMVEGSTGIIVMNATAIAATTVLTPTAAVGANSNNKFYSNTIQNCNYGIAIIGYAASTPFAAADFGNDVGGSSSATGNTIINYGGGGTTNPASAVRTLAQYGLNISYNTVNNNNGSGVNHGTTLRGIYVNTATSANASVLNNTVTLNGGATTSQVTAIENASGSTAASNSINISNNLITNCTYTTATSGAFYGIYNTASSAILNMSSNLFTNNSTNATSGSYYPFYNTGSVGSTLSINNNTVSAVTFSAASTSLTNYNVYNTGSGSTATISINNNNLQGFNFTGATGGTGAWAGIYATATGGSETIQNNTFNNIALKNTGSIYLIYNSNYSDITSINSNSVVGTFSRTGTSGSFNAIYNPYSSTSGTTANIFNNNFSNISNGASTGALYMIYWSTHATQNIYNNTFSNISAPSGTSTFYGIYPYFYGITLNMYNNTLTDLTYGNGAIYGLYFYGYYHTGASIYNNTFRNFTNAGSINTPIFLYETGNVSSGTYNVYKNKISDITSTNATASGVTGINVNSQYGGNINVYNNLIANLAATASSNSNAVNGINVSYATSGINASLYYNTIYLSGTSSASGFGSSAIFANTTANVKLLNNIAINNSTPTGSGIAAAYRRSSTTLTSYGATSNNNLFYAGTPSANTAIFTDGTNTYATLAAYKTAIATRDQSSVTENPAFVSTAGTNPNFLHFAAAANSAAESGAINIAGYTDDYDADIRQGNAGYVGTGTSPDIGADEFQGTTPAPAINSVSMTPTGSQCIAIARNVTANITPGSLPLTSVVLNYSFNGVAQPTIALTGGNASATSNWIGTIPAATPVNANVTWFVTTTDGTYTKISSGPSYKDEPLTGITVTAVGTPTNICAGSNATLTASAPGTATLGTGTGANGTSTFPAAYGSYWGNGRTQFLVLASELQSAGLGAGNITSLAFDVTAVGSPATLIGYTIKVGPSALTSLSTYQTTSLTTVYSSSYTPVVGSFASNTHLFSTPFNWDGVSNVVVDICFSNQITGSTNALTRYSATSFNSSIYYGADGTGGAGACGSAVVTGGPYALRPNMLFGGNKTGGYTFSWTNGVSSVGTTNPLIVSPATNTTYSVIATEPTASCTSTSTPVTIAVTPLPSAPTTTNSSQCGIAVPAAAVAGGSGYNWYATATSTTVLQSGTSATYTTSIGTTTTFYVSVLAGVCEGPRAAVTASVTLPDAVTAATSASKLCPGGSATLTAVQTGTNNVYSFSWTASPAAGSGMPTSVSGSTAAVMPTVPGTYIYSVTATGGACTTISSVSLALNDLPPVTALVNPTVVCSGANVTLDAQSIAATASTGTVGVQTSADYLGGPYRGGSGSDYKAEWIFTAAELSAAGFQPGNITAMSFSVPSGAAGTLVNYTIKMGATAASTLGTTYTSGLSTYFGPVSYAPVNGVNTHILTTPYYWNGTSNIIIDVCNDGGAASSVNTSMITAANNSIYSAVSGACATLTGGTAGKRPVTVFSGQVGTNVSSSMTFVWNPGGITTNTAIVSPSNPGGTPITQIYTVSVTSTVTTCSNTGTVGVLINPLPATPTAVNSNQCGLGIPTASVNGGTSYKWYATPTSTTVLQSGASANYTTSINSTTSWYVSSYNGTCESPRALLTASVVIPDGVTATSTSTSVCPGGSFTLTATKTGTVNTYNYTWTATPAAGSGIPTSATGATTAVTPVTNGNYSYLVTAIDGVCTTTASINVSLNALPVITAVASPTMVCSGSTVSLVSSAVSAGVTSIGTQSTTTSTQGITPYGSNYEGSRQQYLITAAELSAANIYAGNITSLSFSVTALGAGTFSQSNFTIKLAHTANTALASAYGTPTGAFTTVYGPATQPLPSLGLNGYTFSTAFNWDGVSNILVDICHDNDPTATCASCYSGNSTVAYSTTSYNSVWGSYADNAQSCGVQAANTIFTYNNRPNITFGAQVLNSSGAGLTWQWNPGAINSNTASVTPINSGTNAATQVYTITGTSSATGCSNTATTSVVVNPIPTTPVAFNSTQCGVAIPTASATGGTSYKWYATPTSTTVLQSGASQTYTTSISSTTSFYVSSFNGNCESPRALLTASVTVPDAVTASVNSSSVCPGAAVTLSVTQTGSTNVYTYNWTASPATGSGIPTSVSGASVVITPSSAGTYVYTVTAVDGGCTALSTVNLTVFTPPNITVTSTSVMCSGSTATLSATSTGVGAGNATIGTNSLTDYTGGPYRQGAATDNKAQWLFTAAELTAANIAAGNITALSFSVPTGSADVMNNFTIKMGTTSNTALTTTFDAGATVTVFTPASVTAATGLNTYNFTTPFNWDGVSNVVIQVCHDLVSGGGGSTSVTRQSISNRTSYSNISGACAQTAGTSVAYRPVVVLAAQTSTNVASSLNWVWNPGALTGNTVTVNPVNTGTTTLVNVYTVTVTNPVTTCTNTAISTLSVNPIPTVSVAASTGSICSGTTASLTATGATTYSWMPAGGSASVAVVSPVANTVYTVTGTSAGCSNTQTINLNVSATPTVVASASPSVICAGATLTLTANGATTYSWMPNSSASATTTAAPTVSTIYTVTGTTGNCSNTKTVSTTVNTVPTLTVISNPAGGALCTTGATATLTATGTSTAYVWSNSANTASTLVAPSATTVYSVTGTNSCGTKTATVTIAVATTPTISATSSSTLSCSNSTVALTANATPGVTYSWNTSASTMSISVSPSVTTTYTVTGTNACGTATATIVQNVSLCTGIDVITGGDAISIYPNPATDYVNIAIPASLTSGNTTVEVTDALGKLVMRETLNTDVTTLSTNKLEDGIYFFKVITNNQTIKVGKVVKN
jgi:hypothetical protein